MSAEETASESLKRRQFLKSATAGLVITGFATTGQQASAQDNTQRVESLTSTAFAPDHKPVPLPFNAASLDGLSQKLIESHWSNNYGGSVRTLNAVKTQLAEALQQKGTPAFAYNALKREHLMRTGSVILHELYFGNLGGDGRPDSDVQHRIGESFGDFASFETEFNTIALGLGGGSGWVVLAYNSHFQTLENYWLADHMHFPASSVPLLVLDMYEHSYQMDYGAATARYVEAFFRNIQWDAVAARLDSVTTRA